MHHTHAGQTLANQQLGLLGFEVRASNFDTMLEES